MGDWIGAPYSEPDTSRLAALAIVSDLGRLEAMVYLAVVRAGSVGRCNRELEQELGLRESTVCPRVWTLVGKGLLEDSGERRLTPSGRWAKVWKLPRTRQLELFTETK